MANDFQDQEEIENFKYFWRRWGRWLFGLLLILAAAYLGWVVYQGQVQARQAEAAQVLETFVGHMQQQQTAEAKKSLMTLQQDYAATLPAAQATLMMAATDFDAGRHDDAAAHLQWVRRQHSSGLLHTLASQRLAVVYLQKQQYAEALAALDGQADEAFKPLLLETRGDVLLAQGKSDEAAAAYAEALKLLPEDAAERPALQLKADQR